jgi:hypothetical protein
MIGVEHTVEHIVVEENAAAAAAVVRIVVGRMVATVAEFDIAEFDIAEFDDGSTVPIRHIRHIHSLALARTEVLLAVS